MHEISSLFRPLKYLHFLCLSKIIIIFSNCSKLWGLMRFFFCYNKSFQIIYGFIPKLQQFYLNVSNNLLGRAKRHKVGLWLVSFRLGFSLNRRFCYWRPQTFPPKFPPNCDAQNWTTRIIIKWNWRTHFQTDKSRFISFKQHIYFFSEVFNNYHYSW